MIEEPGVRCQECEAALMSFELVGDVVAGGVAFEWCNGWSKSFSSEDCREE